MRWKAFFYENGSSNQKCKFKTFGFKSVKSPPANERLVNFENDLYNLIKSVKFHKHNDKFQERLSNDVRKIKKSSDVFVFADKTTNIYKIKKDDYNKLLTENITKSYKKSCERTLT